MGCQTHRHLLADRRPSVLAKQTEAAEQATKRAHAARLALERSTDAASRGTHHQESSGDKRQGWFMNMKGQRKKAKGDGKGGGAKGARGKPWYGKPKY